VQPYKISTCSAWSRLTAAQALGQSSIRPSM
jgi:hypothetical protein